MYKVLIIDDEPWSREVIKEIVNWESMQLEITGEAEDGTEGLKLIREHKPDIVITDMRMPGVDGVELLKTISSSFPSLKIIVMSGYDDYVYLKQAIRSRVIEYLLKPIDPDELNASLEKCIEELNQVSFNLDRTWRTPPLFADTDVLEKYLAYRRLIYGHLQNLDKTAVLDAFKKLETLIEELTGKTLYKSENENILAKISYDFIHLLEEFLLENGITLAEILNKKKNVNEVAERQNSAEKTTAYIAWLYEEAVNAVEESNRKKSNLDLEKVKAYIDKYFSEPISLNSVSRRFFISKEHLCRAFKNYTGENLSDYITRKRMEKAKELISEQGLEIKHAAQMAGYTELAYFYRIFKKYFGYTPGELRKKD